MKWNKQHFSKGIVCGFIAAILITFVLLLILKKQGLLQ